MRKGKDLDLEPDPYGSGSRRPKNMRILRIRIRLWTQHWYLGYNLALSRSTITYSNLQYQYGTCYFCGSIPTGNLTVYQLTCRVLIGWRYQHAAASCRYSSGNLSALHPRSRHQQLKPVLWIQIHWIRISSKSGYGSWVLMTKNWKNIAEKIYLFWSKTANYLSLGLLRTPTLQEKPSAFKREQPALQ